MHILTISKMNLTLVVLVAVLAGARADCDACVAGRCHSRRTLVEGFHVSDHMAVDRHHDILYMHLNFNMNIAFFFKDMKIRQVQLLNTSRFTVNQEEHVLYTLNYNDKMYKYEPGNNSLEALTSGIPHAEADLLFHKNFLYYTVKCCKGLYYIDELKKAWQLTYLSPYNITDFVIDADDNIYFVTTNTTIYMHVQSWEHSPEVFSQNKYVLSVDKYGVVYFGDASKNVIYKMDNATKQLVDYAAYKRGTVENFEFDDDNNIVFHDSDDGSVNLWKPEKTNCSIYPPHDKYVINISSSDEHNDLTTPNYNVPGNGAF